MNIWQLHYDILTADATHLYRTEGNFNAVMAEKISLLRVANERLQHGWDGIVKTAWTPLFVKLRYSMLCYMNNHADKVYLEEAGITEKQETHFNGGGINAS